MINALQIASTGMRAQQTQLDVISHNLANVSTTGFKRSSAMFEDLIYQNLRQVGAPNAEQAELPTGLQLGLGVRPVATARTVTQGSMQKTENQHDVALNGDGFFQIEMPDGSTAYTRDGSFKITAEGRLVNNSGMPVIGAVTIPRDARSVTIGADGQVTVLVGTNPAPQPAGTITLATFINPAGLEPRGQNLFTETAASGEAAVGAPGSEGRGPVLQGFLESSNVNVVQELVAMIQTQRAYELNSRAVQTSDQMLARLAQI